MIHQLYGIIQDNTAAQLIKENKVRKFYLGGTGSDEFAIMFTSDYVEQIQQAKEQYLKDLQESCHQPHHQDDSLRASSKRKALHDAAIASLSTANKRVILGSRAVPSKAVSTGATAPAINAGLPINNATNTSTTDTTSTASTGQGEAGQIFDRFKELILNGHCLEISIQHSNIQSVIGATDRDITTLIRYSLLNRDLSQPANPHLVNLNQPAGRGNSNISSHNGSNSGSSTALNQLIHATNQEQARNFHSDSRSSSSSSLSSATTAAAVAPIVPTATTTITASLGRREQVSDDVAYRFAIRQGGLFVTHFLKGRLEILRMIRRQTFHDMLASAVIEKPLRGSFLPHEFHIHDIVGSGRVRSAATPSGQLLKLTQKGEASVKTK
ncbi:hypothetical protein BGX34_003369 [Mortierella sp. NVP85]|nr:hypothetical protein BGX34_003369 [Mortierella sp. NVP85]